MNSQSDYEGFVWVERICSLYHDESHHGERELNTEARNLVALLIENMPSARLAPPVLYWNLP